YFRLLAFKLSSVGFAIWTVIGAMTIDRNGNPSYGLLMFILIPTTVLALMVLGHAREQLATWQSSLIPGYRRPHLVVAGAFFLLAMIALPLLLNILVRLPALPLLTFSFCACAILGWLVFDPSIKSIVLLAAVFSGFGHPAVQHVIQSAMNGRAHGALILIWTGSLGLFAWIGWQMSHLHEAMPQYRVSGTAGI